MAGSCKNGNEPTTGSIKDREFLGKLKVLVDSQEILCSMMLV
jgi:hypothetical protein